MPLSPTVYAIGARGLHDLEDIRSCLYKTLLEKYPEKSSSEYDDVWVARKCRIIGDSDVMYEFTVNA